MLMRCYTRVQAVRCIAFQPRNFFLHENFSCVASVVNKMNSTAAFLFVSSKHCLVNMVTPHSFAAKLGQKRRMKINNSSAVLLNNFAAEYSKPARKNDCVSIVLFAERKNSAAHRKTFFVAACNFCLFRAEHNIRPHKLRFYAGVLCTLKRIRILAVAENSSNRVRAVCM